MPAHRVTDLAREEKTANPEADRVTEVVYCGVHRGCVRTSDAIEDKNSQTGYVCVRCRDA